MEDCSVWYGKKMVQERENHISGPLKCTVSVVVYNDPPEMLRSMAKSVLASSANVELHIVDNSENEGLNACLEGLPVLYQFIGKNLGYGKGHNRVIEMGLKAPYHIICNPDVIVASSAIDSLYEFMEREPSVGVVCPKILNTDGSIQFLNKRYPTVLDLFIRRFIPRPFHRLVRRRSEKYEMKDVGYENTCDVEFVSGSFMFCRSEALKKAGGFDERYFMYLEDADLSRKIQMSGYRTVYYPYAEVTHHWKRASHKNIKMTWFHTKSAIQYFDKWGWKLL